MSGQRCASEAFWSRVSIRQAGCWEWQGPLRTDGYGRCGNTAAHRVAYEIAHGPVPDGLYVCHQCDNPLCCNPDHLWVGTPADNYWDMRNKGRLRAQTPCGEHSPHARLTEADVREIRALYATGDHSQAGLARRYGVRPATISKIVTRRKWKHIA